MKRHVFQCPLYSGQTPDLAVAELTAMKMLLFPRLDPSFFALFAANSLTCMAEFSISCVFCLRRSFLMDCCCGFVNDSGWSIIISFKGSLIFCEALNSAFAMVVVMTILRPPYWSGRARRVLFSSEHCPLRVSAGMKVWLITSRVCELNCCNRFFQSNLLQNNLPCVASS